MNILTRPMRESDVAEADSIFRLAFGTFLGLPDPATFAADRDYIRTRFLADPGGAIVAEIDGKLAGSNLAANWGSFGTFGPLTVRPEYWNTGVAQALLAPTMEIFDTRGVRDAGLFTFVQSPKHICLYQKFNFWPRLLIGVMTKTVTPRSASFTAAPEEAACAQLTNLIFEGLDAAVEIRSVHRQKLGETVLLWNGEQLEAFAICHCGEGTEAGAGNLYIKFAAVRPGSDLAGRFARLLAACEALANQRGLDRIEAGVHLERTQAYRDMLRLGFRMERTALAMHRDNSPAYNRPDTYVLDDWR
jgi:GNAT superfamily N-acetyltransferase